MQAKVGAGDWGVMLVACRLNTAMFRPSQQSCSPSGSGSPRPIPTGPLSGPAGGEAASAGRPTPGLAA